MPVVHILNGRIEELFNDRGNIVITVRYREGSQNRRNEQTIRMVVGPRTIVLNMNGIPIPASALSEGMIINAVVSSAMTRSIPPQANAYTIKVVRNAMPDSITVGRILEIDQNNRSITVMSDRNLSSTIRFNVPEEAMIFGRTGRRIRFSNLMPGMRVRVRHANFMTSSIPPQTTAFEIRVL